MDKFQREDRYIVIKRSDLAKVPAAYRAALVEPLIQLQAHLPCRASLVIESDWPEFEIAYQMIEARMAGQPTALESALGREAALREELDERTRKHLRSCQLAIGKSQLAKDLQQRLTVAEQRAGELGALLLESNELLYVIQDGLGGNLWSAVDVMRGKVFAALKPVEECPHCDTGKITQKPDGSWNCNHCVFIAPENDGGLDDQ